MTLLLVSVPEPGEEGPRLVVVQESYDKCVDMVYPVQSPSSSLEVRANITYTLMDGRRICLLPGQVLTIEEDDS